MSTLINDKCWQGLVKKIDQVKGYESEYFDKEAYFLEKFLSINPDAEMVRNWFIGRESDDKELGEDGDDLLEHEISLYLLVGVIANHQKPDQWSLMSATNRGEYLKAAIKSARDLVGALREKDLIDYPHALALFDENTALGMVSILNNERRECALLGTGYIWEEGAWVRKGRGCRLVSKHEKLDYGYKISPEPHVLFEGDELHGLWCSAALGLDNAAGNHSQSIVGLLENLINYLSFKINEDIGVGRVSQFAGARLLALELDKFIYACYQLHPNEMIAACVSLVYPELKNPVTGELVRSWRGAK